jgi:serine/threonine protein kinase
MELIARGRAGDVFDLGDGWLLKRHRDGPLAEHEAAVTEYARSCGYPVPAVRSATPTDLELERLEGRTMMAELAKRPWRLGELGRMLGELHRRLHELPAPPDLPSRAGAGPTLVHLDLHPENVLLTPRGPVVIDWTAGGAGHAAHDVGMAHVILATSDIPGPAPFRMIARAGRELFLKSFLRNAGLELTPAEIAEVAQRRLEDPHVNPAERARVERLVSLRGS